MCRSLGIPARYVSGYLFTDRDDTGEVPVGDTVFVQTHAWMEAAVPGWGWLALDPTNGQVVGEHTLLFASGSEHIALTHRAFDRRVFATGAVRAALWLHGRTPGLYGMADVLGMGQA